MNDTPRPRHEPADGELLSAYLDGELDDDDAAELEARLEHEPALLAHLESVREVVEALAALRAPAPEGYAERLASRLEEERSGAAPSAAGRPHVAATGSRLRGADRPAGARRAPSGPGRPAGRRNWAAPLTAAAALVAVAVLGGLTVLGGLGVPGSDDAATSDGADVAAGSAESGGDRTRMFAQDEAGGEDAVGDADVTEEAEAEEESGDGSALGSAPASAGQPSMVETGVELDGEAAANDHLAALADALAPDVLGLDLAAAEDVASAARITIQRAEPFSTGVAPEECLDAVTGGSVGPAVPVAVESLSYDGRAALAYLVVSASSGADTLDRVEGWVVDPNAGCVTRLFLLVTP